MTSVSKIKDRIIEFVMDFNRKYSSFPLITFQFVSLDEIPNKNSKLIWWTFCHKDVALKYYNAVKEFTGYDPDKSTSKVTRTLIKWEHNQKAFWYEPLGDENVIENTDSEYLYPIKHIDPIGAFEEFSSTTHEKEFLDQWKNILNKTFDSKGATMWVSMQHSFDKDTKIPSHVFCLFNKKISDNYKVIEVYREIEKFIVDYLIDLYKAPVEEQKNLIGEALSEVTKKVGDENIIVGNSELIKTKINEMKDLSANPELPIFLLGPTGTGKSHFAEHIIAKERGHTQKNKLYYEINCAGLDEETAYSRIFGHKKGAFTSAFEDKDSPFKTFNNGTIFLDEVHWLSKKIQAQLNVFLAKKHYSRMGEDILLSSESKLIFASNLSEKELQIKLNPDFFSRISTLIIVLPSLKELGEEEIETVARELLSRLNKKNNSAIKFSSEAINKIKNYSYPENFRELNNCIIAAFYLAKRKKLTEIPLNFLFFKKESNDSYSNYPTPVININTEGLDNSNKLNFVVTTIKNMLKAADGKSIYGNEMMESEFMNGFGDNPDTAFQNLKNQLKRNKIILEKIVKLNPTLNIRSLPGVDTILNSNAGKKTSTH